MAVVAVAAVETAGLKVYRGWWLQISGIQRGGGVQECAVCGEGVTVAVDFLPGGAIVEKKRLFFIWHGEKRAARKT